LQKSDFDFEVLIKPRKTECGFGLLKESFGASTIVHDFYEVETANYYKLDQAAI
jgi:hypothetical protein